MGRGGDEFRFFHSVFISPFLSSFLFYLGPSIELQHRVGIVLNAKDAVYLVKRRGRSSRSRRWSGCRRGGRGRRRRRCCCLLSIINRFFSSSRRRRLRRCCLFVSPSRRRHPDRRILPSRTGARDKERGPREERSERERESRSSEEIDVVLNSSFLFFCFLHFHSALSLLSPSLLLLTRASPSSPAAGPSSPLLLLLEQALPPPQIHL